MKRPRKVETPMSIERAMHWAFSTEFARLEYVDKSKAEDRGYGFGMEYVLIQRARLGGVQIDTSRGRSDPHIDAETIAALLTTLPEFLGGIHMARAAFTLSRADIQPNWMEGAVGKIEPKGWKNKNRYGRLAKDEHLSFAVETVKVPHPRNPKKMIRREVRRDVRWCPCTWNPHPHEIESARMEYERWWKVLFFVQYSLKRRKLFDLKLTDELPDQRPWEQSPKP